MSINLCLQTAQSKPVVKQTPARGVCLIKTLKPCPECGVKVRLSEHSPLDCIMNIKLAEARETVSHEPVDVTAVSVEVAPGMSGAFNDLTRKQKRAIAADVLASLRIRVPSASATVRRR